MTADDRNAAVRIMHDLVAFPTVTSASNLDLIAYATERFEDVGATVVTTTDAEGTRANVLATIGPPVDGGVVLSGHTDVVPADGDGWSSDPFTVTRRDDRLYGRGTADMKGFIACLLALAPTFAAADLRAPLHVALTFDEEVGFRGAPLLLDELARTGPVPRAAIVGEPTSLRIITAHKGCYEYTTRIVGRQGHGSMPAQAVNAVEHGARYVARLLDLRAELAAAAPPDSPFDPPATTISVGRMTGGTARNIVADTCTIEWEMRPVSSDDATRVHDDRVAFERTLSDEMRHVDPDASVTTTAVCEVDGLEPDPASSALALGRLLLDDPDEDVVSFGTEAGLFQRAGIPAVVCGPGSIDVAHKPDEFIEVGQLDACLAMLHRLLAHLRDDRPS